MFNKGEKMNKKLILIGIAGMLFSNLVLAEINVEATLKTEAFNGTPLNNGFASSTVQIKAKNHIKPLRAVFLQEFDFDSEEEAAKASTEIPNPNIKFREFAELQTICDFFSNKSKWIMPYEQIIKDSNQFYGVIFCAQVKAQQNSPVIAIGIEFVYCPTGSHLDKQSQKNPIFDGVNTKGAHIKISKSLKSTCEKN